MTAPAKHTPGFGRRLFVKGGPLNGAWIECEAPHAEWLDEAEKRLAAPDSAADAGRFTTDNATAYQREDGSK